MYKMTLLRISLFLFLGGIPCVLSDFTFLNLTCTTENDEHMENCSTDPCELSIDLKYCNSLVLQCVGPDQIVRDCNSPDECGVSNLTEIVRDVTGKIHCDLQKYKIECFSRILCEHKKYLHICNKDYCGMKHTVQGSNSDMTCKFNHNLQKCVHENTNFSIKGGLNCTTTPANILGRNKQLRENCSLDHNDSNSHFKYATIVLGLLLLLGVIIILILIVWIMKLRTGQNGRNEEVQQPREEEIELRNRAGANADNNELEEVQ